jgi:hypothetical protein
MFPTARFTKASLPHDIILAKDCGWKRAILNLETCIGDRTVAEHDPQESFTSYKASPVCRTSLDGLIARLPQAP